MIDVETCLKYVEEKHYCPHCKSLLSCCHTPPFHVGDGLGWGSEIFFVCLNDECSLFANSWQQFENSFGHSASCRYMKLPGEQFGQAMMVGGVDAFKGCVVDPESLLKENTRFEKEKDAVAALDVATAKGDIVPAMTILLDEMAHLDNRLRACESLGKIADLSCIDPIRNHKFFNQEMEKTANLTLAEILKKHYLKECPYCAELVKAKASLCKHCGKGF